MDPFSILLIAFGLAMDAFAVSITSGISIKHQRMNHALRIGLFFGFFQAIMPAIGWLASLKWIGLISGIDHWVAFGLLSLIGCKMIYESRKLKSTSENSSPNLLVLLGLSIATSLDALAVGVSFGVLKISIATPIIMIGAVTFLLSFLGVLVGNKIGHFFESKIEALGGLILIGIGIKILIEHLT